MTVQHTKLHLTEAGGNDDYYACISATCSLLKCSEAKVKALDYVTAYYMLHSSDKPSLIDEKEVCRTIFVGGLTQGATADMLRGLFSGFGTILVSGVMLQVLFYYATSIYTVKPVLRDHCHERPPVLKDNKFLAEGPKFQYN